MGGGVSPHNYHPRSAPGYGRWQQCEVCGTTKHSGYYWHGGHKSKVEPPACQEWGTYPEWRAQALPVPLDSE